MKNTQNLNKMNQYIRNSQNHKIKKIGTKTSSSISSTTTDNVTNRIPKNYKILFHDLNGNSKPIKSLIHKIEYKNENDTTNDIIKNKNNNIINESLFDDLLEIEGKRIINHLSNSIKLIKDGKFIINSKSLFNDNDTNIINNILLFKNEKKEKINNAILQNNNQNFKSNHINLFKEMNNNKKNILKNTIKLISNHEHYYSPKPIINKKINKFKNVNNNNIVNSNTLKKKYIKKKSISNDNYSNIINHNKEDIISYLLTSVSQRKNNNNTSRNSKKDNKKIINKQIFQ